MGFFDRFKNNNKQNVSNDTTNKQQTVPKATQPPFYVEYSKMPNGNLQVDFYDMNSEPDKFYDATRLIVGRQPLNIEGHQVCNCAVSWYGQDDCQMFDEKTGKFDSLRAQAYKGVLAEIDLVLLQTDPQYCQKVMKGLLDQRRVEKYLENGLQENPSRPCGKYIGGVMKTEKGYQRFFSENVGKASHNSDLMINRRQERRKMIEEQKQKDIANKKAQIEKLQSEVDDMER